jgi:hypothetical protein
MRFCCSQTSRLFRWLKLSLAPLGAVGLALALAATAQATENTPQEPFGAWADVPWKGQFVLGLTYLESEAYTIWARGTPYDVTVHPPDGQKYGIDINQGWLTLQYGITEKWAADLSVGFTSEGWRSFSPGNSVQSTSGMMDVTLGVRYQAFNETTAGSPWIPTLTFRASGVLPGTYDESFIFAPGDRSASIEPEVLARKHFGWTGLGAYADAFYRWNRTIGNSQYSISLGLFQQIKGWELDAGLIHFQTISGGDILYYPDFPSAIVYPRDVREIRQAVEAGFSYTTAKLRWKYQFYTRTVFAGNNSDRKFWIGGTIEIPFGGKKPTEE